MAWEIMQATCTQKYTVLDTVFTDWINRKVKTKNTWLLKYFKVLDCSTLFLLGRLSWLTKQVDPGDCGEGGGGKGGGASGCKRTRRINPPPNGPGARFSKVPVTLRARNQIFKSKYKE